MAFFEKLSAMAKAASDKASVLAKDAADKASELAKTAADKANTAIEVSKLNGQIRNESDNIAMAKSQMGHLIWERYSAGDTLDPALQELCEKIVASLKNIDELNRQIEELKAKDPEESVVEGECELAEDEAEEADPADESPADEAAEAVSRVMGEIKAEAAEILEEVKEEAAEAAAEMAEEKQEQ